MVKLKLIDDDDKLYNAIQIAFLNDYDLINIYHLVNLGFIEAINDTYDKILEAKKNHLIQCYEVWFNEKIIGYTVICKTYSYLYSFGINKLYRNSIIMANWWEIVLDKLGNKFTCALWTKNTRALNFLMKNGMKISDNDNVIVQLIYN